MRFYFDIDDELFEDEFGLNFQEAVKSGVVESIADIIYNQETSLDRWHSEVSQQLKKLIADNSKEICNTVIEKVTEHVLRMKTIKDTTPRASEFAALNKENVAYFEEMIDKAIAKRFTK